MIYYLQFNAANLPGLIQVNNSAHQPTYFLQRLPPRWQKNYELLGMSQDRIGTIQQTSRSIWPNYQVQIGDRDMTKVLHLSNSQHQLMVAPGMHWLIQGHLIENNYIIYNYSHQMMMTVDNIYYKNGHEGFLLNIHRPTDHKVALLIAAVLNQTSRNTKNNRSLKRLLIHHGNLTWKQD